MIVVLTSADRAACAACRARGAAAADVRDQAVLAAVVGAGTEGDRLILPGGIERREIVGIGIGLCQQAPTTSSPFGFAAGQRDQRAEHRLIGRLALAQPFGHGREDMRRLAEQLARLRDAAASTRNSRNSGRKSGSSAAPIYEAVALIDGLRSIIAWPRSRLSPCTCSNRCSDSERVRSNSST